MHLDGHQHTQDSIIRCLAKSKGVTGTANAWTSGRQIPKRSISSPQRNSRPSIESKQVQMKKKSKRRHLKEAEQYRSRIGIGEMDILDKRQIHCPCQWC